MKTILIILLPLLLTLTAHANDTFEKANKAYEAGQYEQAIAHYEKLSKENPRVSVLNNLGSAYFQSDKMGKAILAFERGLVLKPKDAELNANLKLAREKAAVYPPEPSKKGFFGFIASSRGSLAAFVLSIAVLLMVGALLLLVFRKRSPWLIPVFILDLAILTLILWKPSHEESDPKTRGIVTSKTATVRLSPFEEAGDKGQLPAGREVSLGESRKGYYWVNTPEIKGWLSKNEVEPVIP